MAKYQNPQMIDDALNYLKNNAVRLVACNAQPTTYAEAMTTYALGTVATVSGNLTLAAGDTSGRKITHAAATLTIGTSGTVTHLAFCGTTASGTLLFAGTCAPTAVSASGTLILNSWKVDEIQAVS